MSIECNQINQVANELKMKFVSCGRLEASDLQRLVDLVIAASNCNNAGTPATPTGSFTAILAGNKSLGKYVNGSTVPSYNNLNELIMDLGRERILPIFNMPEATITTSLIPSTTLEVGTVLSNVLLTAGLTQNDGGNASNYRILRGTTDVLNSNDTNTITQTLTLSTAPIVFKSIVSYNAGTTPKNDSLGTSVPNPITSGSDESTNITYVGFRKIFYGPTASKLNTATMVRTLPSNVFENVSNTITLESGTTHNIFQFWLPTGKNLVSVLDDETDTIITNDYISEPLSVNDVGGTPVSGTLYTKTNDVPYLVNHSHIITIS